MPHSSPFPAHRILIIRLGALGDLLLCAPAFQAIREAYPRARIALLTQPQWADFASAMPWFDDVIDDARPRGLDIGGWMDLLRRLRRFEADMVFDLQGKFRQDILFWLLGGAWGGFAWSGANRFCRFPRIWPPSPGWHFQDFIAAQLGVAGVAVPQAADFSWLDAPVDEFSLPEKFALIVPGSSKSHPEKRWCAEYYAEFVDNLAARGLGVAAIGAGDDRGAIAAIKAQAPELLDLCGRTSLLQIGALARRAQMVLGNDTGPTHIAAAVGAPTLALFSGSVNPAWSQPRGAQVQILQEHNLAELPVQKIMAKVDQWIG